MSSMQAQVSPGQPSSLRTRLGVLTLLLLCAIQFMDVADTSIVNVALPSIQHSLHFSQQNLQWVASGYLLTYGGFLLLGGRAADLLGRRRVLVAGLIWFAVCSAQHCSRATNSGHRADASPRGQASESIQRSSRRPSRVISSGSRKVLVRSAIPW